MMQIRSIPLMLTFVLAGCDTTVQALSDGGYRPDGKPCSSPVDFAGLGPGCAAADGLIGDRLVCVDFSQNTSTPFTADAKLAGWDFTSFGGNCWTVKNGKLQINTNDFTMFKQSCGFMMEALKTNDFAKYNSFTLAVVQTIDISDFSQQKAQVLMGADDPQNRLVDQTTGKQPRKQWVNKLAKSALPNGINGPYQPLFKFVASSAAGGSAQGWQIESIAILGTTP